MLLQGEKVQVPSPISHLVHQSSVWPSSSSLSSSSYASHIPAEREKEEEGRDERRESSVKIWLFRNSMMIATAESPSSWVMSHYESCRVGGNAERIDRTHEQWGRILIWANCSPVDPVNKSYIIRQQTCSLWRFILIFWIFCKEEGEKRIFIMIPQWRSMRNGAVKIHKISISLCVQGQWQQEEEENTLLSTFFFLSLVTRFLFQSFFNSFILLFLVFAPAFRDACFLVVVRSFRWSASLFVQFLSLYFPSILSFPFFQRFLVVCVMWV